MDGKIYLITNSETGKEYVGKTTGDVSARFDQHLHAAVSQGAEPALAREIRSYGRGCFSVSVLRSGIQSHLELKRIESYYIALRGTLVPRGYNTMP